MNNLTIREAVLKSPGPKTVKEYIVFFIKAFCMGCADLIPGVSGGTIAFITGIYEDLLAAVASINKESLLLLGKGRVKQALSVIHVRVLFTLLLGMLTAIFSLARLMHYLMTSHTILTWAVFFGLISASIIVIFRELEEPTHVKNLIPMIIGIVMAWLTVSLIPVETPTTKWFIYLCGIIGISAMILPGLSGSFLLLILGKYEFITSAVKNPFGDGNFGILIIFATGSVTGVVCFSRVLNYFLKHYRCQTMAFLTGILIGSMKKVWPWKQVLETVVVRGKTRVLREANIWPQEMSGHTVLAFALIVLGFIAILVMENKVRKV